MSFDSTAFSHVLMVATISFVAAMSPGPDFFIVTRTTLSHGRLAGLLSVFGVCLGLIILSGAAFFGLSIENPIFIKILYVLSAVYLVYLGGKGIAGFLTHQRRANAIIDLERFKGSSSKFVAFRNGFLTNLINPKAMAFLVSISTIMRGDPTEYRIAGALSIPLMAGLWFSSLTFCLSFLREKSFDQFNRYFPWVEFALSLLLLMAGLSIAIQSVLTS
jgi:threonine/homoserine/homoserine lactone efflux protein